MNGFDQDYFNDKNKFHKSKQDYNRKERLVPKQRDDKVEDNISIKLHEDDNDSLSSYRSTTNASSQESVLSQPSSRSVLNPPDNIYNKRRDKKKKSKFSLIYIQMHINILYRT